MALTLAGQGDNIHDHPPRSLNFQDKVALVSKGFKRDEEFLEEYETMLVQFVEGEEQILHLPPMNSYFRRLTHKLAGQFGLNSYSEGEEEDRHIVVERTQDTKKPTSGLVSSAKKPVAQYNFGDKEFLVDALSAQTLIYLTKDGFVGAFRNDQEAGPFLDKRLVSTGSFKIKQNRIIEIHDPEW